MSDNTASNLGTGQGIFAQKVGDDLQFKSLVAGTNVTLTADSNNITITASNDTTALNLGTGSGLFTSKSSDNLQLKSIIGNVDSGITVISNSNDLTLQLNANVDAGKLGGVAASDFLRKSDNLASVTNLATARTNLSVYSKAEVDANTLKNNAHQLPDTDSTYSLGSNSYKWLNIYADNFYGRASVAGSIDSIANIGDVDVAGAVNGSVLKYNSSTTNWEIGVDSGGGGGGSSTFVGLSDTPGNFTGDAGKYLKVNSGANAIEFDTLTTTDVAEGTNLYYTDARADARAQAKIDALVDSAPGTLDTLNELAAALGDDANFSTTITNSIATKLATADFNTTFDTRLSGKSTSDVSEGTNLYYTNARADARIGAAQISDLSNVHTAAPNNGEVLAWDSGNSRWAPSSTGAGDITAVVAGTGLTGGATSGSATLNVDVGTSAGKIVQLDGSAKLPAVDGSALTNMPAGYTNSDVDTHLNQSNPTSGYVLSWNGSDYAWVTNAGYTDSDFDTRLASKSTTNLTEGSNLYYTDARVNARVLALGSANWNTAYGWGNHASAGYLTSIAADSINDTHIDFGTGANQVSTADIPEATNLYYTNARADARVQAASLTDLSNVDAVLAGDDGKVLYYDHSSTSFKWKVDASGSSYTNSDVDAHLNQSGPTSGYVLSWNGSDYAWVANGTGGITDIVNDTTPQLGGTLDANGNTIDMGTNVLTDTNLGQFITAYGWGNHASAGYLTSVPAQSFASLTGKPTTIAGYGITDSLQIGTSATTALAGNTALFDGVFASLTSKPTTIAGYGITDSFSGAYADLTGKPTLFDNSAFDTRLASKDTGDVAEGSNLYFTNARADARITNAGVTGAKVTNWDTAYGWGNHASAGYLTSVPAQSFASLTGKPTTISGYGITDLNASIDAHLNQSNPTSGYVLSWNGSDYAWVTNAGYTNTDFDNRLATKTTANLTEGSNLYYTDARANSAFDTRLATKSTTNLSEGTNLYYTDARADARITNALIDEDNMASDSATRLPSQQSVKAYVDSQVASENELSEMNDVTIASLQNNQFLKYNTGTSKWENVTVTAASAAGSDTYVQFNDSGVMGADGGFTYNKTTDALTVGSVTTAGASPSVSAAGALSISTTASNGNITLATHGTGDVILSANVKIDGSDNDYLKWTAPYSNEAALPNASTYHGMFAHVHGTGKGYFAHGGNWIKLLDETSSTTTNLSEGTNLYYTDVRADARITAATLDEDNMASDSNTKVATQQSIKAYVDSSTSNSSNWDTAYGWGNHASAGYLTSVPAQSFASLTGKPSTIAGYGITDSLQLGTSSTTALAGNTTLFDNSAFDTRLAAKDTGDVAEGSNLYYTNARADARIAAAGLTTLSDVDAVAGGDDGKILYYDHSSTSFKWKTDGGGGGTFGLAGNTGTHTFNTATETLTFLGTTGQINAGIAANNVTLSLASDINSITSIAFEGSTADNNETKLQAVDPTADRTINLPDASGHLPVFATASPAAITDGTSGQALVTNGSGQLSFTTISGGGGSTGVEMFKINYATNGTLSSITDTSSGISSVSIDSASGGDITINFTGYSYPPASLTLYGYVYAQNKYTMMPLNKDITLREIPGGGSSGSPTAFGSFGSIKIKASEGDSGASRSFGTVTHAWVQVVMGG